MIGANDSSKANRLVNYFPDYENTNGIFQIMVEYGAPWDSGIAQDMDIAYFTMYSGIKTPSQFVIINSTDGEAKSNLIAKLLWNLFGKNWKHLWDAYNTEYTPIDNYSIKEVTQRNETDKRDIKRTTSNSQNTDTTDTMTYGQQIVTDDTISQYNYGFNSTEQVPTHVQKDDNAETHSGTDKDVIDTDITSAGTDDTVDNDTINEQIQRTRSGNIGQTSYQDLLRQEFELWRWNFYTQVFNDVDRFLTLSVFCPVD